MMTKLDTAKAELRGHGYVSDKQQTMDQWAKTWLTEQAHKLRPKTHATYSSLMRQHILPVIGKKKIAAIAPADLRRIRDGILRADPRHRGGKPLSTTTALQAYRVLSHCLEDARRERLITENVCDRVDPPKRAKAERGAFTLDQARSIIRTAADQPGGSRFIAQIGTGMRQSELLGLTLDDVDLDAREIHVRWQLMEMTWQHECGNPTDKVYPCGHRKAALCPDRTWRMPGAYMIRPLTTRYALAEPKSVHGVRRVPLIEPVALAIHHHLATVTTPNPHRLVWRMDDGSPIPHKTDQAAWRVILDACGLPADRTTHWMRHSVATHMMERGKDAKIIGGIVGHGSVAVTREYQHVSSPVAHDAMQAIGELFA